MLEYRIISSNGYNIYKVKFEGKGKDLKAYCTCPAGKKGGKFCKHISGLINKDTTNLVEPSDKIEALDDVLQGSPLLSKNEDYVNKREKKPSLDEVKDEKRPNKKKDNFQKKLVERTSEIFDEFYIKLKERQKLLFECGLPKNHFIKFGAVPVNHPQKALMNILKKYENFGISINAEMKIKIKNEFYELINEKYPGYPNIDKTILPDNNYEKNDNDKVREKIEDFLDENMEFLIDAFMLYTP